MNNQRTMHAHLPQNRSICKVTHRIPPIPGHISCVGLIKRWRIGQNTFMDIQSTYRSLSFCTTVRICQKIKMTYSTTPYHTMLKILTVQCVGIHFHRGGELCAGSCEERYSPLVYSYDLQCSNCSDSHHNSRKNK